VTPEELTLWRRELRTGLLARRESFPFETRTAWGRSISSQILAGLPILKGAKFGIYWPIKSEYDPRFVAHTLREHGTVIGLPVVVAKGRPLIFREWHPGTEMLKGGLGIPYPPASAPDLMPDACVIPPVGFDKRGYRLGYGGGFFDRTLASMSPRPLAIGVAFDYALLETIYPQTYDIALDFIVTESALYAVNAAGLTAVDAKEANRHAIELQTARRFAHAAAAAPEPGSLSSPVCYARELAPGSFGEEPEKD
jgi:5-formyltetrahydrofolate cyclo-ligase